MEIHNVFAYDIVGEDLASRMSIAIKKEQIISKQGLELKDEIVRRQSMINIKDFVKDLKQKSSVQDQDQETELTFSAQPLDSLINEKDVKMDELSKDSKKNMIIEKENNPKDILNEQISKNKGRKF